MKARWLFLVGLLTAALMAGTMAPASAAARTPNVARTPSVSVSLTSTINIKYNRSETLSIVNERWPSQVALAVGVICSPLGGVAAAACAYVAYKAAGRLSETMKSMLKSHPNRCLTERINYPLPWRWYSFAGWEWRTC